MVESNENWEDWEEENMDVDFETPKLSKIASTSSDSVKVLDP